jgi:hypothetical protein
VQVEAENEPARLNALSPEFQMLTGIRVAIGVQGGLGLPVTLILGAEALAILKARISESDGATS